MAAETLQLQLQLDVPAKTDSLKIASNVSVAQLVAEAAKHLGIRELKTHDFRCIAFASDAKLLSAVDQVCVGKILVPHSLSQQTLAVAGIRNRSTIHVSAPISAKPEAARAKPKSPAQKTVEKKTVDRSVDRYKNLRPQTILAKLCARACCSVCVCAHSVCSEWFAAERRKNCIGVCGYVCQNRVSAAWCVCPLF